MSSRPGGPVDWRDGILADSTPLPSSDAVRCVVGRVGDVHTVMVAWEFASHGGSFGEADATAFIAATDTARVRRLPLVTMVRSGGTRLSEGMRALVGIPRTALALQRLRTAGLPHISVADHPTTGGVWVAIGSRADVRIAIDGALIGFSGPRPIAAMTGRALSSGSNRAASAYDAGLVDLVVEPTGVAPMLARILTALLPEPQSEPTQPEPTQPESAQPEPAPPDRDPWTQVTESRASDRPNGASLLTGLLDNATALHGADDAVAARIGRLGGHRVVGVALAAARGAMPNPGGFALLSRAADLAGALDLALVVLIDSPGADPHTESDGLAAAIAAAMGAVLETAAPSVCLIHGEGGSGGALAGAVTDVVGVGPHGWFAALGPEGAAATLRTEPADAAKLMNITPRDLLASGFADAFVPAGTESRWIVETIDRLRAMDPQVRQGERIQRWSAPLSPRSGHLSGPHPLTAEPYVLTTKEYRGSNRDISPND